MSERDATMTNKWKALFSTAALAVYPVLFLYAHNQEQTYFADLVRPLVVTVVAAAVVAGGLVLVFRDATKGGLGAAAFFVLFFGYGHVVNLFPKATLVAARATLVVETLLFVAILVALFRTRSELRGITNILAVVAGGLLLFSTTSIAFGAAAKRARPMGSPAPSPVAEGSPSSAAGRLPDIYYVILDSYASERSLKEFYSYDNGPFLDALRARGFHVAAESKSNYGQTLLSLSSSLNMTHLDEMTAPYRDTGNRTLLMDAVRESAVVRELKEHGYHFVNISSGFSGTDPMPTADVELKAPRGVLSEFEILFVGTTPLAQLPVFAETADPFLLRRFAVLHGFETLADLPDIRGPKFVLAHVLSPHPPFVFDRDGNMRERRGRFNQTKYSQAEYVDGYRGQVEFVNAHLLAAIDGILRRYPPDALPIIIVQGDHGPRSLRKRRNTSEAFYRERFSILNAYLLPPDLKCQVYDSISPVNSFRVIFGCLFGENREPLPDESYYSTSAKPFAFEPVSKLVHSDSVPEGDDKADDEQ